MLGSGRARSGRPRLGPGGADAARGGAVGVRRLHREQPQAAEARGEEELPGKTREERRHFVAVEEAEGGAVAEVEEHLRGFERGVFVR